MTAAFSQSWRRPPARAPTGLSGNSRAKLLRLTRGGKRNFSQKKSQKKCGTQISPEATEPVSRRNTSPPIAWLERNKRRAGGSSRGRQTSSSEGGGRVHRSSWSTNRMWTRSRGFEPWACGDKKRKRTRVQSWFDGAGERPRPVHLSWTVLVARALDGGCGRGDERVRCSRFSLVELRWNRMISRHGPCLSKRDVSRGVT